MTALSLALAYLGTLAFVAWRDGAKERQAERFDWTGLASRVAVLEDGAKSDQQLRDTVSTLAIAAGMKPRG